MGWTRSKRTGLRNFVWVVNTSLARFLPAYDSAAVERRYLELWQQAAIDNLGVRPLFRRKPAGLATDEAVAYFLRHVDWRGLGAVKAGVPKTAEPLILRGRMRRQRGKVYERVTCGWGDLFMFEGLPAFFRPVY